MSICLCHNANGLSSKIRKKYPDVLITYDHGILSENDLISYTWGRKSSSFMENNKDGLPHHCWQCFPRNSVRISLDDKGYSNDYSGKDDNCSEIIISVWSNGVAHKYYMRRYTGVDSSKIIFDRWQKLMKNEKYVCLAGIYSFKEEIMSNRRAQKRVKYYWTFDRIKTKKGCDSYFVGHCNSIGRSY